MYTSAKSAMMCAGACRSCVSFCLDCISQCNQCPNTANAEHQACIAMCKECIFACEICIRACEQGSLAEMQSACGICMDVCDKCAQSCLSLAAACTNCSSACSMCANGCADCARECSAMVSETKKPDMAEMKNNLKAVLESPYELVVENHIVLFGGRDLTGHAIGENQDGSLGEYFSKATDLESDYTKTGRLYVDFEHGQDPDSIGNNNDTVLGFVDWKTAQVDDEGVIVRRVLNRRHRYMKWLEPLIKAGLVGNSSQSVRDQIEKAEDGEIKRWALKRDTLTFTPMEPRMIDSNAITALKALADDIPYYKALLPELLLEFPPDSKPPDTALPDKDDKPNVKTIEVKTEKKKMDTKEEKAVEQPDYKRLIAEGIAEALKAQEDAKVAKAAREAELKTVADAAYKQALEDVKTNKATSYHTTEKFDDDNDGVQAFKSWMTTGEKNQGLITPDSSFEKIKDGKAAWNVTTGSSGGFLVPDPLYNQIIAKRNLGSWVRQMPVQSFQTPSDHLLVPRESTSHTNFVLTAEAATYNEDEGTVTQKDLILYKYTKSTKVNEEFLSYQGTNWESWFSTAMGRAVATTENTIYTTGTGTAEPEGVVTGATVANTTATTDVILGSELSALCGFLGAGYAVAPECGFLMNNKTKWYIRGITSSAGGFLYQQTPDGNMGQDNLLGFKVVVDDDVVTYTTASSKCVVFGNYNYYGVVEKPGMIIQRNPYLYMATGQIGIFASIFRGGGVLQGEAFYYLTNAA